MDAPKPPEFSGPYASLLTEIWQKTDSDFVRGVIEDGAVSDQEWAETSYRLEQCLQDNNIAFLGVKEDGTYGFKADGRTQEEIEPILVDCEERSGESWINMLRLAQQTNPSNEPPEAIVRECMLRIGVVEKPYSAEEYLSDQETLDFPLSKDGPGMDGFWACNADPRIESFSPETSLQDSH